MRVLSLVFAAALAAPACAQSAYAATAYAATAYAPTAYAPTAYAQNSAPLQPYAPPATSSPLAPLPGQTEPDPPLGNVRASSRTASNNGAADTRSIIAPALPSPDTAGDTPQDLLMAARKSIRSGQTGAAQEALERAASRLLSRDVAPSEAGNAIQDPMIQQINAARQALSVGNSAAALAAVDAALRG